MKILVPYISDTDVTHRITRGGIERFTKLLYLTFPDTIVPVQITKDDRKYRRTEAVINQAILDHSPDGLINNNIAYPLHNFDRYKKFGIPLINIIHEPLVGDIRFSHLGSQLQTAIKAGAHIYFVSENQLNFHKKMYMRRERVRLPTIKGFVRTAFAASTRPRKRLIYDAVSIGRSSGDKDPFKLHIALHGSDLHTLVITNDQIYRSDAHNAYADANRHWYYPQETMRNLPHSDVMNNLSRGRVFVSTCTFESWGITALEALSCGLPTILLTDKSGNHSSESIAACKTHIVKLPKSVSRIELFDHVYLLGQTPYDQRCEIAEMTQEKHSWHQWKQHISAIIDARFS
jgi:glycosyltransferase involved in cell wall biosynthesis